MESATRVLFNGTILTMDAFNTVVPAIAFKGERILATGGNDEMLSLAGPGAERTDLNGATVIPGFYDAHGHFFMNVEFHATRVDLNSPPIGDCRTFADCLERLKERAAATPPGEWVQGYGFDDTMIAEKRFLTRHDLDQVSTEHPIVVSHISGHLGVANTLALKLAGFSRETPDPAGGVIRREADGTPNGILEETAVINLYGQLPQLSCERLVDEIEKTCADYAGKGITNAIDAGVMHQKYFKAMRLAAKQDRLPIRVTYNPLFTLFDEPEEETFQSSKVHRGGVKLLQDGSIQCFTAYMSKPYYTPFKGDPEWRGYPTHTREKLFELIAKYHKAGHQIVIHTNGDAASEDVLDAIEAAQKEHPVADPRFLMVHAQNVREDQLDRFKKLGVTPTFYTLHVYYWGDRHKGIFLGPERAAHQNPMRSAIERGIVATAHCDVPVVPVDPFLSIWACVNRISASGEVIGPEQRISVVDALRAHTINPAWQNFEEKDKGSLEPGKFADLAVLDTNPLECAPERLRDIKVMETIVGGKTIFIRS